LPPTSQRPICYLSSSFWFFTKKTANMTSQNTVIPTAGFTYSPDSGLAFEARNVNKIYNAGGRALHALKSIDIEVPIGCIYGAEWRWQIDLYQYNGWNGGENQRQHFDMGNGY
jgi:hypothetical protein